MTRTVAFHDFKSGTGEPVYRVSFDCQSDAEREAVRIAGLSVVVPAAFQPATPPSPDPVGSQPPNCDFGSYIAHAAHDAAEGPEGCDSTGCVVPQAVDEH
jgi:hypothetical protein